MNNESIEIPMVSIKHPKIAEIAQDILLKNASNKETSLVPENILYPYIRWIADTNHVLISLGLLVNDLVNIEDITAIAGNSLKNRLYTYTRAFYSEFYRARELHARYQARLVNIGYLDKKNATGRKKVFHDAFSGVFKKRNEMTHDWYEWGESHHLFQLSGMLKKGRMAIMDTVTNKPVLENELLLPILLPILKELTDAAMTLHAVVQEIAESEESHILCYCEQVEEMIHSNSPQPTC